MKRKYLKTLCAFLSILMLSFNTSFSLETNGSASAEAEEFDFANGLFSRGMYDMSIKGYEEFLERFPESNFSETAKFRISESRFLLKQYDKAILGYKSFIANFPSSEFKHTAELRIAQILLAQKEYKDAEKILLRLIGIQPSPEITAAAEYYLGLVYFENKRYVQAKKVFQDITVKKTGSRYLTFSYISLGEIFLEEGDSKAASEAFSSAVEYTENKTLREKIALRAGEVHSRQKKYEKAKSFYRIIIDEPNDPDVYDNAVIGYLSSLHSNGEFDELINQAEVFLQKVSREETKAQLLFIIGNRYFNSDEYTAAKKAYSEAANMYPDTEFGLMSRLNNCWVLYRLKEYDQCLAGLKAYVNKSGKRQDEAIYIKARVYADMGDFDKSLEAYNVIEVQYPGSEFKKESLYQKAWIFERSGEKEKAVEAYLNFAQNYPQDNRSPSMLLKSAQANYQLKKYDEAVDGYKLFLETYPESLLKERAIYQMGNTYLETGKTEKGIKVFEGFLNEFKSSEANKYVLFSLGRAYQTLDQWDKAIEKYDVVIKDKKMSSDKGLYSKTLESIAFCYFKKGNKEKAAEEYYKLILQAKEVEVPEGVFLWVSDYYLSIKDNEKSLFVLGSLKEKYPELSNPGDVEYLFAQNYLDQDKLDNAIRYFEQAISAGASSPYLERSFLGLGQAYYKKGEYDKALVQLEKALEKHKDDKTSAFVRFEIGKVYFKKESFEEAAKQYMMVAILYDDKNLCSTALFQAGISFLKAGKADEADGAFKELIQRYPETPASSKAKSYLR